MENKIVRLLRLQPLKAAVFHSFGLSPEGRALRELLLWAQKNKLLQDASAYFLLGRKNPLPIKDKKEYGYDCMITLPEGFKPAKDVTLINIKGGFYAVMRSNLSNLEENRKYLHNWVIHSNFHFAGDCLEELLTLSETDPDHILYDLWMPVQE